MTTLSNLNSCVFFKVPIICAKQKSEIIYSFYTFILRSSFQNKHQMKSTTSMNVIFLSSFFVFHKELNDWKLKVLGLTSQP